MSTRTAALPVERDYLSRAWLVVAAIVIVAATLIGLAIMRSDGGTEAGTSKTVDPSGQIVDYGPPTVTHGGLFINGRLCGQCR